MKIINNSICAAKGFLSSGIYAGLKKNPEKKDIALIYSETPATVAGVFTINQAKAAPVILTQAHVKHHKIQAIIINSGNANACTGEKGMEDALMMANTTANALNISPESVAVASTGVIGVPLPIEKIITGIETAVQQLGPHDEDAMEGIMTTDTFSKSIAVAFELGGRTVHMGGISKGSGMIHPMMATMLAFVTTDVAISQAMLQQALIEVNEDTFHMITVDGDTSTNDMVLVLANGAANNGEVLHANTQEWEIFKAALTLVCTELAKLIAKDGEGATKLIEVKVVGAASKEDARIAARAVCKSPLVKSAISGEDANWGRIVSAIGASGIEIDLNTLSVFIGDVCLLENGRPLDFDESLAKRHLEQKIVHITANLGMGNARATGWGCDLTCDYIKINTSYRS